MRKNGWHVIFTMRNEKSKKKNKGLSPYSFIIGLSDLSDSSDLSDLSDSSVLVEDIDIDDI